MTSLYSDTSSISSSDTSSKDPTYVEPVSKPKPKAKAKPKAIPKKNKQQPPIKKQLLNEETTFTEPKLDEKTGALVLVSKNTLSSSVVKPVHTNTNSSSQSLSKVIRQLVWNKYVGERNGLGKCWCCRNKTISAFEFEAGHVIPRAKGGPDTVENLRPICSLCNKSMGTENMLDYQKRQNLGPSHSQVAWEWICNVVSFIPLRIGW